ncbi:splicing factor 3A subunit 2-like [Balaenoptera ricei]|uniref:splicing factor 3A subunit 2-like n=1 Tax=Balaenoptera ricei TaxID=2746895 RepID=UPI0028BD59F7|nr:splicing factor 3A subunit 2-like [Balaenoptera ricei]
MTESKRGKDSIRHSRQLDCLIHLHYSPTSMANATPAKACFPCEKALSISTLHCSRKRASRVARERSENLSRSSGWGPAPGQPPARRAPPGRVRGAARQRSGLRPSDLPRKPGGSRRRPESPPTCCARGKPDFPGAQEEGRRARLLGRPRAAVQPLLGGLRPLRPDRLIPRPVPAPGVPASYTASLPRPPRGPSSRSTYSAGPGVWFLLAGKQHGHRPLAPGAASTAAIPDCSPPGSATTTTQRPSQPRHVIGSTALGLAGGSDCEAAGREGRARGGTESSEPGVRREPAIGNTPRTAPRPRQPAAELSSAHTGRRDCSTSERAMAETAA